MYNKILIMLSHQELGEKLELFMTHQHTAGSVFLLPNGTIIWRALESYFREQYKKRGYQEVITPRMANVKLWKKSGHFDHYSENMFHVHIKEDENKDDPDLHHNLLSPMNCIFHCLIFESKIRSYRDLPIRFADFGVLHRNEASGALHGMTRLRKFSQDDAHIFCRSDQIQDEIANCLNFLKETYDLFGFSFRLTLSTRPDKFMGDIEIWENAEQSLVDAIKSFGSNYTIKDKDGAFYGPKLDVMIKDYIGREFQCGTIQLDFQLPEKFELKYKDFDGSYQYPVIIHRAICGSLERMMAILIEHYQGKFPLWLSFRQVAIVPVAVKDDIMNYCNKVKTELVTKFKVEYVDIFDSSNTFNYRVREIEQMFYNYVIVIGQKEMNSQMITFRTINHKREDMTIKLSDVVII